jgi:hypothetical protein
MVKVVGTVPSDGVGKGRAVLPAGRSFVQVSDGVGFGLAHAIVVVWCGWAGLSWRWGLVQAVSNRQVFVFEGLGGQWSFLH